MVSVPKDSPWTMVDVSLLYLYLTEMESGHLALSGFLFGLLLYFAFALLFS